MASGVLNILGKPVVFTTGIHRLEGCTRYRIGGKFPPGPCKKVTPDGAQEATPGGGSGPKKVVPKAKKVAPKKAGAKKQQTAPAAPGGDREALVKRMLGKPDHFGFKMAYIIDKLKAVANKLGGKFDREKMMARVTTRNGTGEMLMTPQGWTVNIQRRNSAPYTRTYKSVDEAAKQLETLRFVPED